MELRFIRFAHVNVLGSRFARSSFAPLSTKLDRPNFKISLRYLLLLIEGSTSISLIEAVLPLLANIRTAKNASNILLHHKSHQIESTKKSIIFCQTVPNIAEKHLLMSQVHKYKMKVKAVE